jgi:quercetin dioxygenase-like cupin family protein
MQGLPRRLEYVAALAIMISAGAIPPALAQQAAPTTVTTLMKQAMTDFPDREVIMITLDIPPGGGSPPHRHPGHHIFGYVLEGTYKLKLDQGPETVLTKGQTFYEASGQLHAVSANASQTEPAKILAVIVAESGKPITVPEKQ